MMPDYANDAVPLNAPIASPTEAASFAENGGVVERPMLRVEWRVSLHGSAVSIQRAVPLGETADETMAHLEVCVTTPGHALAKLLIAAYFQAMEYAIGVGTSAPAKGL